MTDEDDLFITAVNLMGDKVESVIDDFLHTLGPGIDARDMIELGIAGKLIAKIVIRCGEEKHEENLNFILNAVKESFCDARKEHLANLAKREGKQ